MAIIQLRKYIPGLPVIYRFISLSVILSSIKSIKNNDVYYTTMLLLLLLE